MPRPDGSAPRPARWTYGPLRNHPGPHGHQLAVRHNVFDNDTFDPVEPQVLEEDITHGRS
ncbi:hypothetical protein ABZV34_25160 [Streptomyces sp. NPDC005195]|uniref:hypothetical protein n=1 Tax=Streptomyces sp. NPDC005195 TaxID=3154561 RepID=UPI0033AB6BF7